MFILLLKVIVSLQATVKVKAMVVLLFCSDLVSHNLFLFSHFESELQ